MSDVITTGATLDSLIKNFFTLIGTFIPMLAGFALLLFLWGCVKYIYNSSETKGKTEGKEAMIWGIIALFVLFSIWGILGLLAKDLLPPETQFGDDHGDPNPSVILPTQA